MRAFLSAGHGRRQAHFVAPRLSRHPATVAELVGGGGECVRHRVPDVLAAVAVEIVGERVVLGRHELREAHGAGPGGFHRCAREEAVLEHLQRMDELVAEHVLAAAGVGLRGQHLDGVVR